jgi:hypothetical protein
MEEVHPMYEVTSTHTFAYKLHRIVQYTSGLYLLTRIDLHAYCLLKVFHDGYSLLIADQPHDRADNTLVANT